MTSPILHSYLPNSESTFPSHLEDDAQFVRVPASSFALLELMTMALTIRLFGLSSLYDIKPSNHLLLISFSTAHSLIKWNPQSKTQLPWRLRYYSHS
jgi:hypothetical protein